MKNAEALNAAAVRLQEQGNNVQQAQQALSAYSAALESGDVNQIQAAQKNYRRS